MYKILLLTIAALIAVVALIWRSKAKSVLYVIGRGLYNTRWIVLNLLLSSGAGVLFFQLFSIGRVLEKGKKESILNLVVTIVSITAAILITYLFSKLFAERQERANRKQTIDKLSFRVNELRNIAYCLKQEPQIWNKLLETRKLDQEEPSLTVFQFRGEGEKYVGYERAREIEIKYGGPVAIQGFLSLRELQNNETAAQIDPLYVTDYTVDQLARYCECATHISYFLDQYKSRIGLTDHYAAVRVDRIQESYFYLTGKNLNLTDSMTELATLFSESSSIDLRKLQYFVHLNSRPLPRSFYLVWINLLLYVLVLFAALIQLIVLDDISSKTYSMCIVGWFIGNTVSLILTITAAISSELAIEEYYVLDKSDK